MLPMSTSGLKQPLCIRTRPTHVRDFFTRTHARKINRNTSKSHAHITSHPSIFIQPHARVLSSFSSSTPTSLLTQQPTPANHEVFHNTNKDLQSTIGFQMLGKTDAKLSTSAGTSNDACDWGDRVNSLEIGSGMGPSGTAIDTLSLTQRLGGVGFSSSQSETVVRVLMDVIRDSHHSWATHVTMERDFENHKHQQELKNEDLKHKIEAVDKTKITLLQFDVQKNQANIKELREEFKDEIEILKGHIRLDFNLEKGRTREEISQLDDRLGVLGSDFQRLTEKTQSGVATDLERLKTQIEQGKLDAFKFFVGALMTSVSVSLAFYRFVIV